MCINLEAQIAVPIMQYFSILLKNIVDFLSTIFVRPDWPFS